VRTITVVLTALCVHEPWHPSREAPYRIRDLLSQQPGHHDRDDKTCEGILRP